MKVIICGAGQVGYGIAKRLVEENNSVTVIERSPELIQRITETLDVKAILGHGSHPEILDRAGAKDADMLISVTFADEVNMVAAQIAHSIFNVPMKIARVRSQSYLNPIWQDLFSRDNMPIDVIISPELEVGDTVLARLSNPGAAETASFAQDKVKLIGVRLAENCPVVNTPLSQLTELFPDIKATVVGIVRDARFFVPAKGDQMLIGDYVYVVTDSEMLARTIAIFGHEEREAKKVLIIGGGNIGFYVAQALENQSHLNVKIIESNKERAVQIADQLKRTVVLLGDGLDQDILREAGIGGVETVVSLTNSDEVNILASVIAKQNGASQTMCLINDSDYSALTTSLGIDAFIDPKAITVSRILQHVRRGRIRALYSIAQGRAEVIEAEALETSPLVGTPLKEARLPDEIAIGAIIRGDEFIRPRGDTRIEKGDTVVLLAERGMTEKVEKVFRVSLEYF